ncbi:hypothetical protein FB550_101485 [Neobacillus bataviensis]|uniref:Uncharacterized protein n=1 Tax=Neobacillus bataviensis TaxID=220685 RepID=A0A561DYR8_9BACI|nr:hypothetical protein [Neobacillus bataviensis]TWE08462.1 hypothetical protein FB550_101485 [Neobacillus bataviensis]
MKNNPSGCKGITKENRNVGYKFPLIILIDKKYVEISNKMVMKTMLEYSDIREKHKYRKRYINPSGLIKKIVK